MQPVEPVESEEAEGPRRLLQSIDVLAGFVAKTGLVWFKCCRGLAAGGLVGLVLSFHVDISVKRTM